MKWTRIGGMTAFIAVLAIALALSLGLWGSWTARADPAVRWVNAAPNPATEPADCTTAPYPDITTALAAAADDDIIRLCEGNYSGNVTVTKKVKIEGRAEANRDDIVVQGASPGLVISVDGVTISHLKLVGAGTDEGVKILTGADGNTIQNVEISNWNDGVRIEDAEDNVVETSDIHANADDGVDAQNGADNTIRNNEITANKFGVYLNTEDGDLVEGNTISDNTDQQIRLVNKVEVRIERNNIAISSDGIRMATMPAESLVIIGGSADKANTFTGFTGANFYVRLDCDGENTVDATYNWWGSTNPVDIANRIFNDENDPTAAVPDCPAPDNLKGAVVFHPWATGPAPTPTPTPTPTTTVTPTPTVTATPTPTGTPAATRTIDLSPQGWHDLAWSGANATDPGTALACIAGKYSIAYAWEGPTAGFKRYVEGCAIPGICNMSALNKYDTLLVLINAAGVTCVMPVATP